MIFDHVGFHVTDFAASRAFLIGALAPLGIRVAAEGPGWAMLGKGGRGQFWFGSMGPVPAPIHLAFAAENREQVRQFHAAALAAGRGLTPSVSGPPLPRQPTSSSIGTFMFIAAPEDSPETAKLYQSSADSQGFVMNLTRAWAWRPEVFDGFAALRTALTSKSSLSKRELAVLVCASAAELGDSYCSLAWGRTLAAEAGAAIAAAVIERSEDEGMTERERALAEWARQVVADPNATTASDVDKLRRVGLGDREIFEATLFIAFRQAFSTVNDALGVQPDRRLSELVPAEVRAAVSFGRATADA
jgi:uncharacterized peroxidase-related enzyme